MTQVWRRRNDGLARNRQVPSITRKRPVSCNKCVPKVRDNATLDEDVLSPISFAAGMRAGACSNKERYDAHDQL